MKLRKLSGKCCKDLEDQGLVHMCRVFDAEGAGYIGKKEDYLATAHNYFPIFQRSLFH